MQSQTSNFSDEDKKWHHPSKLAYRILILVLACAQTLGGYMGYDSIGALSKQIERNANLNSGELGILIGSYSAPNIVMAFAGGVLCDYLGYNRAGLLFGILITIGATISALGVLIPNDNGTFIFLLLGRFILGIGSENLLVAQTLALSKWFSGKELAMSFGMTLTFGRFGSILSFWILPPIAEQVSLTAALWTVAAAALFSLGLILLLWKSDVYGWKVLDAEAQKGQEFGPHNQLRQASTRKLPNNQNPQNSSSTDSSHKNNIDSAASPDRSEESEATGENPKAMSLVSEEDSQDDDETPAQGFSLGQLLRDTGKLPTAYWMIVAITMLFYGSALSFTGFSTTYLIEEKDVAESTAARLSSMIYWASMILSPLLGFGADLIGYRVHILFIGSLSLIPTFALYAYSSLPPWILGGALGFAYSLIPAASWPSVPLLVERRREGSAFGLLFALYNLALFVSPIVFGFLKTLTNSYTPGLLMYASFGASGAVAAGFLYVEDYRFHGNVLKKPSPDAQLPSFLTRAFWKRILCTETQGQEQEYSKLVRD